MDTKTKLMQLLAEIVPTADYLNAENVAVLMEGEYGTLTDLRTVRGYVIDCIETLAEDIDRLKREVDSINEKPVKYRELIDSLKPTERFPSDDEQTEKA